MDRKKSSIGFMFFAAVCIFLLARCGDDAATTSISGIPQVSVKCGNSACVQ